jgi:capsular polysaccharide biosynthesis protein
MELVGILRELWRHRLLVLVAAVVAALVGYAIAFKPPTLESRQYEVGLGSTTALVDTPSSQVVDLGGETGADIRSLSARATLLASLMTSSPIKDEVAAKAGVDPEKLIAVPPSGEAVGGGSGSATKLLNDPDAIVLKARVPTVESGEIPIVAVDTQAPDAETAEKLANESVTALKNYLQSVAGNDHVPNARRVVVTQLGPARASTQVRGTTPIIGVVAFIVVFLLGCVVIVGVQAFISGWQQAAVEDAFGDDESFDFDDLAAEDSDDAGLADEFPRPLRPDDDDDEEAAAARTQTDAVGF